MDILNFIEVNLGSIIAVIIFGVILLQLWRAGKKESVKEIILSLVVKAESVYGSGTGEIKYASVVEGVYKILPSIVTFFISEKELDRMIEEQVKYWKECLQAESSKLGIDEK